ncbi:MAG: anaerobic glycerol-3-phosphate dehydrogenase subunit C, partial [Candidatus Heimdallarchaeaceae archaeon]
NSETIEKAYPDVPHNATGYELRKLIKDGKINLTRLFVGSEGTLGIITKAKMRIANIPKYKVLSTAYFDDLMKAGKSIKIILEQEPAAIELLGKRLLEMARKHYPELDERLPKELDTMLLIEFDGDDLEYCKKQAEITKKRLLDEEKLAFDFASADEPEEQEKLWEARKSAVPLLYKIKGDKKIIAVIEDAVVPTDQLAQYVYDLEQACKDLDIEFIAYGHAAKGLLHNRPLLDMKNPEDILKMEAIADKSFELVKKYGGAVSGEHSDGRIRAKYIRQLYGDEVFNLFKDIKQTFDPEKLFNPDVKVTASEDVQITNLRFGEKYSPTFHETLLTYGGEEFNSIIETCIGCAKCGIDEPVYVMCPVYKGKPEEHTLTRGKNNILRGYIEGEFSLVELLENRIFEYIIFNCVGCQQCAYECPSEVNTAKLMAEMKIQYMQYHKPTIKKFIPNTLNPIKATKQLGNAFHCTHQYIRNQMLANIDFIGRMASVFAPFSNWITSFFGTRVGLHLTMGLNYKRRMPAFKNKTFKKWWKKHNKELKAKEEEINGKPKVAYFHGCSANVITPDVGIATVELLEKLGVHVEVPSQKCCGSPAFSYGAKGVIDKNAEYNINVLDKLLSQGYDAIITSCTSCSLALKEEYLQLRDDEKAKKIAENTYLTTEYIENLLNEQKIEIKFEPLDIDVLYHTPCHLRAQREIKDISINMIQQIPELNVEKAPTTCCGISGSWGMKNENYNASIRIGKPLLDAVNRENIDYAVTDCPTCKMQIEHGTNKTVLHPIILLNNSIKLQ